MVRAIQRPQLIGNTGVVCETDAFFYTQVGDDSSEYDYDQQLMEQAQRWNFERFQSAIDANRSPVVVDRGNGLNLETQRYVSYALERGYSVKLKEPDSPWWAEIPGSTEI